MNKQVYAVLAVVCGLLGFNLIAVVQLMSYMQVKNYQLRNEAIDISLYEVGGFYKTSAVVLGLLAILFYFLYKRSGDQGAKSFAVIGLVLGTCSLVLGAVEIWVWFVDS